MLSCLLRKVYIDEEWIAQEYLRRCKAGISGKGKENDEDSLDKCWSRTWNVIEAELVEVELLCPVPDDLAMEEFAGADTSAQVVE